MSLINHDEHKRLINPLSLIHSKQQQIAQEQDVTKRSVLIGVNTQEVVIEKKINISGSRNIHTKEEKTNLHFCIYGFYP